VHLKEEFKRYLSLLLGNPNVFSFARAALYMKRESQGGDFVHLSVICSTFLFPRCYTSFYLAAHQLPKSLCAYIVRRLGGDVCPNVQIRATPKRVKNTGY